MPDETRIEIGSEVYALLAKLEIEDDFQNVRRMEIYPRQVKVEIYLLNADRSKYIDVETGEPKTDVRRILVSTDYLLP